MAERIYQNARRMEAIMKDGAFSFDDDSRNRLQFKSLSTDPMFGIVEVYVDLYLADEDDYLHAQLTVRRHELSFALSGMSVEGCNAANCSGYDGIIVFERDEFRNPTFRIFKDGFPEDAHLIDQPLFND